VSIVLLLAVLAVLGAVAVVAGGRGTTMPDVDPDRAPLGVLPPDEVGPAEVERLRFSLAFRGYRMDEVDDVLDRLAAELADRDARIAELQKPPNQVEASEPARPPEG
jgi:DivIVA domain-containing protein